jgi:iron complex outermembrane receptor protein
MFPIVASIARDTLSAPGGPAPAETATPPVQSDQGSDAAKQAEPTPVKRAEEVVVTPTRGEAEAIDVPASVVALDMGKLAERGFFAGGDEFRGQPGLFFRRGEGDNEDFMFVNIRGVTGNHGNDTFLALVDGIPFVSPNEEVHLNQIPYAVLSGTEIVRGPVSALYGRGGIAGAVNYLTRVPAGRRASIRAYGGSAGQFGGEATIVRQPLASTQVLASLSGARSDSPSSAASRSTPSRWTTRPAASSTRTTRVSCAIRSARAPTARTRSRPGSCSRT